MTDLDAFSPVPAHALGRRRGSDVPALRHDPQALLPPGAPDLALRGLRRRFLRDQRHRVCAPQAAPAPVPGRRHALHQRGQGHLRPADGARPGGAAQDRLCAPAQAA
ncbi:MAG: hypothetical protein MZW92_24420 [Comamonadaceae bacterium]|nr:hypothetical protein [Comamonadaceae bacterium]